jgi:hypothetical protein
MNTRKKIIVSTLLLLLLFAPILFYLLTSKKTPHVPPGQQRPILIPTIPERIEPQEYKINFNIEEESFDFPEKINLVTYDPEVLKETDLGEIAKKLSFPDEPKIVDDYFDGKTISYKNSLAYLSSYVEIGEINYILHEFPTVNNRLDDEEITKIATEFLESSNFTNTQDNIVTSIKYFKIAPTTTDLDPTIKENAEVIQVNFAPNISKYPILTLNPQKTLTYVLVMADGEIYNAKTTRLSSIETAQEKTLKNYQETKNTLDDAVIISVNNGSIYVGTIPENSIKSIEVNDISLAYLQASKEASTIQPIFLLEGVVNIDFIKETLPIILYLPAISKY